MPRASRTQAATSREAITEASARLFKERGVKAVSVADLMSAAGLTHGGFYVHFESKDALTGIACTRAFEQAMNRWQDRTAGKSDVAAQRAAIIDGYLTPTHVSQAAEGCPTAALAVDVARESLEASIRTAYLEGLEPMIKFLAGVENTGDDAHDRREALADYAAMVGGLLLARATAGHSVSQEILAAVRERLIPEHTPSQTMGAA